MRARIAAIFLAVMVLLLLPLDSQTIDTLRFYDNAICVVFLVEGVVHPEYNAWRDYVSDLSLGRQGWVQMANFVVFGLLMLAFAVGLRRARQRVLLRRQQPVRSRVLGVRDSELELAEVVDHGGAGVLPRRQSVCRSQDGRIPYAPSLSLIRSPY